ncbi:MAG: xanthine dehydrogenase family protein molybdopterin-binding subunit [Desulfomonile tiedjei]|uniref:Xanthine dehydrogenase family protein molybdopterin-binding subunit n=1 Tax=Desulfomonile tiedjei TaxID=2358 RepID=A0A9D6V8I4_9BACT|nr:xanthine dehydrogenase family protein molybdopterin-binding subunit [Desulfomonile tiedjei]
MNDQNFDNKNTSFSYLESRPLHIGASVPRLDAYEKVTGKEKYAADYYGENLVWAGVKRAGVPHAVLRGIDFSSAVKVPGIVRVLTHEDITGSNRQGVIRKDQPVLVNDKARHCGDAIALVLADNKESLKEALDLIVCDFEPLPGVFDSEQGLRNGAALVHEDNADGNRLLKGEIKTGSGSDAYKECDVIVEACFQTQSQEHAYLETEAGWARLLANGKLEIVCSTQTPFRDRMEVAEALGLDPTLVRIIAPYPGGAFGGKDGVTVQTLLGLAALHSGGRPVKMWWNREESFVSGTKRHAALMYYQLGAKADGTLHFLDVRLYFDTGPYDHLGGVVLTLALEHAGGPYRIPNAQLTGWAVYTNNPIGGAFRGFGVTQVTAAVEQVMDMLAQKLGMDPVKLRLKNATKRGDRSCVGKTMVCSNGLVECLETLSKHDLWKQADDWKSSAGPFKRRGVGIAAAMQGSGYGPVVPDYANAKVELTSDGKIRVYCGVVDMGQGNASTNLQIAGSILGQESGQMELVLPDTDRTLPSGSASASRCTYTFGNALIGAAETLKQRILQRAADLFMASGPHEMALIPGSVRHLPTGREVPLFRLVKFFQDSERIAVHHFRAPVAADNIGVSPEIKLHGLPHTLFSFGACLAAVEVDELTGAAEVKRFLAVSDCGKVLNPQIYQQQIHGGIAQGLGYALSEKLEVEKGRILTTGFSTYIIPTASDVPEIDSIAVEIYEPTGPFGLKGVGEIATNGPLPAVANAVADALGIRVFESPLTAERILEAFASNGRQESSI